MLGLRAGAGRPSAANGLAAIVAQSSRKTDRDAFISIRRAATPGDTGRVERRCRPARDDGYAGGLLRANDGSTFPPDRRAQLSLRAVSGLGLTSLR